MNFHLVKKIKLKKLIMPICWKSSKESQFYFVVFCLLFVFLLRDYSVQRTAFRFLKEFSESSKVMMEGGGKEH